MRVRCNGTGPFGPHDAGPDCSREGKVLSATLAHVAAAALASDVVRSAGIPRSGRRRAASRAGLVALTAAAATALGAMAAPAAPFPSAPATPTDIVVARGLAGAEFTPLAGKVYFAASAVGSPAIRLMRTGGTAATTEKVAPIGLPSAQGFVTVAGRLLFGGDDSEHGNELWASDGTEQGTGLVKDIRPGRDGSGPFSLVTMGDTAYFMARRAGRGWDLWSSDGTANGTQVVATVYTESPSFDDLRPPKITVAGDELYFVGRDAEHGRELWVSDGTRDGTGVAVDLAPGSDSSVVGDPVAAAERPFFTVSTDDQGEELWSTDVGGDGFALVREISPGRPSGVKSELTAIGSQVWFFGDDGLHHTEPWVSDGTSTGTRMVKNIGPDDGEGGPTGSLAGSARFARSGSKIMFVARGPDAGEELWGSDGTVGGTAQVLDLRPGPAGSDPDGLTAAGGRLFFGADDGRHGVEIWMTDGTTAGTARVSDTDDADETDDTPDDLEGRVTAPVAVGDDVYFTAITARFAATIHRLVLPAKVPPPVVGPPSNVFTLPATGVPDLRRGRLTLTVTLPGPGRLSVGGSPFVVPSARSTTGGATRVTLVPTKSGMKKLREAARKAKRSKRPGVLRVRLTFTYTPAGGTFRAITRTYTLKLR